MKGGENRWLIDYNAKNKSIQFDAGEVNAGEVKSEKAPAATEANSMNQFLKKSNEGYHNA